MGRRLAWLHGKLLVCIAFGILVMIGLNGAPLRISTKVLTAWDAGVLLYLILAFWVMAHDDVDRIRRRAAVQDEGAVLVLLLSVSAAAASLVAIVFEIGGAESGHNWSALAIGGATILLSWLFMHTIFALHYAHEYYGERRDDRIGGLKFPGNQSPDYWDFLYFSFVVAMTSQVSDVAITSKVIRRLVNLHGVASFFFNLAILALTINMVSGIIKPG
jgi:uncharacterized membrane protein